MTIESEAQKTIGGLLALSARIAPKAVGMDSIKVEVTKKVRTRISSQTR